MKTFASDPCQLTRVFCAALLGTASTAFAQDDADVLVREGTTLSNGWTVESIVEHDFSDGGSWAAIVQTTQSAPLDNALVVDGTVVMEEGQTLLNGEEVVRIRDLAMGPAGALALVYEVEDLTSANNAAYRFQIGNVVVLREDQPVLVPGVPAGSELEVIYDADISFPYSLVNVGLRVPGQPGLTPAILRYHTPGGGGGSSTLEAIGGAVPPGLSGPLNVVFDSVCVSADGSFAAALGVDVGGTTLEAAIDRTGGFGESGASAGLLNGVWNYTLFPQVAAADGDKRAISGQVSTVAGGLTGLIRGASGVLAREGFLLPGPAPGIVDSFIRTDVAMTADGRTAYGVPLTSGRVALMLEETQVLRSQVSQAGGFLITDLHYALPEFVQISSNGRQVHCIATLGVGGQALIRVDRRIGNTVGCAAVPNSTGQPGRLRAFGSERVAVNALEIVADRMPLNSFGYLGCSTTPGFSANPGGSIGNLCLDGDVGRFVDQVLSSGSTGSTVTVVDLGAVPQPTGFVSAMAGESWGFQYWHRDTDSTGGLVSNFTELVSVTFR